MEIAEARSSLIHGEKVTGLVFAHVKRGDGECRPDVLHDQVGNVDSFYNSAAPALRLDANPDVRSLENAVTHNHIADAAGHLATDGNSAMSPEHHAIRNGDVLIRPSHFAAGLVH